MCFERSNINSRTHCICIQAAQKMSYHPDALKIKIHTLMIHHNYQLYNQVRATLIWKQIPTTL